MRRAYVDSCIFIYWVEQASPQTDIALQWLEKNTHVNLCISSLVRMETLVKPMRYQQTQIVAAYEHLLAVQS